MTQPKKGTFTFRDWIQLLVAMGAMFSMVLTAAGWVILTWTEWKDVPERLSGVEQGMGLLNDRFGAMEPRVVEFSGGGIVAKPTVARGGTLTVSYVLRRTIDCDTDIRVRFYDHSRNIVVSSYTIPAIRAAVSIRFAPFPVSVRIPADLPPGRYSYLPEIIPQNCGVYGPIVPPLSEAFEVTE